MRYFFDILQKNDYRRKLQLLMWSLLPLFIICYLLAFKKTFATVKEYNKNQVLAQQAVLKQDSLSVYDNKLALIAAWKKQYLLDSTIMDAGILTSINMDCADLGLKFREYKPLGINTQQIWTRKITVEGSFKSILNLVHELEQVDKICRVASVQFKKVKEAEAQKLNCTLYIQNVIGQ